MSIKANELRIGNWVNYIDGGDCYITPAHISEIEKGELEMDPIPLTKEWMIKFGATDRWNYDQWDIILDDDHRHMIRLSVDNGEIETELYCDDSHYTTNPPLEYVHQLQNLYFALTGTELTYTP